MSSPARPWTHPWTRADLAQQLQLRRQLLRPPAPLARSEIAVEHGPGGVLVGTDYNGNKYFENRDVQVGEQ